MAGDAETGVTVMKMDEGLDTGAMAMAERVPIGARHDRRRLARRAGAARRRPDGARARRAGARHAARSRRSRTTASPTRPRSTRTRRASTGRSRGSEVHDHIRGLSPFPGAWFELGGARVKVLRTTTGEGSGAPGTVLDDKLTVACGDGARAARRSAARRQAADDAPRNSCAARRFAPAMRAEAERHAALQAHHRI